MKYKVLLRSLKLLALYKKDKKTKISEFFLEDINKNEIEIKVKLAGICRTDIYVKENKIITGNIVLGHEFCGYVSKSFNPKFKEGDYVTGNPIFHDKSMIGIDHNGCFSEKVILPSEQVFKIPDTFSNKLGSYIEPITASLSPLNSRYLSKDMSILILGQGRIAELTKKVLQLTGYLNVSLVNDNILYDCVIETGATSEMINNVPFLLKENGLFIIKSRQPENYSINFYEFVKKNIVIEALYYYDYDKSIEIIKDNLNTFDYLFGSTFKLKDWEKAFSSNENKKIFLEV